MLKFSTDHHFVIGYNHVFQGKPCQDHALSSADDRSAVAVVSDGCSSGGETDMGARMLTFTLMNIVKGHGKTSPDPLARFTWRDIRFEQRLALNQAVQALGFSRSDALATLLYAHVAPSGGYAHIQGDGVVAWKRNNGEITLLRYDWANNTPFYPAYAHDGPRSYDTFIAAHGGSLGEKALHEERWEKAPGCEVFVKVAEMDHSVGAGIQGIVLPFHENEIAQTELLAVFTDGVTQIDGVDWKDAVLQLIDFKTIEGAFAKRRMNRALKDYRKIGNGPLDDIGYAVIRIERDEEKDPTVRSQGLNPNGSAKGER